MVNRFQCITIEIPGEPVTEPLVPITPEDGEWRLGKDYYDPHVLDKLKAWWAEEEAPTADMAEAWHMAYQLYLISKLSPAQCDALAGLHARVVQRMVDAGQSPGDPERPIREARDGWKDDVDLMGVFDDYPEALALAEGRLEISLALMATQGKLTEAQLVEKSLDRMVYDVLVDDFGAELAPFQEADGIDDGWETEEEDLTDFIQSINWDGAFPDIRDEDVGDAMMNVNSNYLMVGSGTETMEAVKKQRAVLAKWNCKTQGELAMLVRIGSLIHMTDLDKANLKKTAEFFESFGVDPEDLDDEYSGIDLKKSDKFMDSLEWSEGWTGLHSMYFLGLAGEKAQETLDELDHLEDLRNGKD